MMYLDPLNNKEIPLDNTVEIIEDDLSCIISIPHSSTLVPLRYQKNRKWDKNILKDTDIHTDKLFNLKIGTKIIGKCNPYFINYSRPKDSYNDKRGVLAWQFLDGSNIELEKYNKNEINEILIEYNKYHKEILKYINLMKKEYGFAIIIDGHSMSQFPISENVVAGSNEKRPDFCFGTLDSKTISKEIENKISNLINKTKYTHSFNDPYKGGYITQKYSQIKDVYIIQIETVKENYCDNLNTYKIKDNEFNEFKQTIKEITELLIKEINLHHNNK